MDLNGILARLGILPGQVRAVEPFRNEEDGAQYAVWKVTAEDRIYVLKQAKQFEQEVYTTFLAGDTGYAPRLQGVTEQEGKAWLLMEYIPGEDLRCCTREKLRSALDALIAMQNAWWEREDMAQAAFSRAKALPGRIRRGQYLGDARLEQAYGGYLKLYERLPQTLCHDDLLPFNVLIRDDRAVIIDWEIGGLGPFLSPLARLIAHAEEKEDAFFYMREADRTFAIDYYYEHLVKEKGMGYDDYRAALKYFLLYEYCEWIMLGNRYGSTGSERYIRYRRMALEHINHLKPWEEITWK